MLIYLSSSRKTTNYIKQGAHKNVSKHWHTCNIFWDQVHAGASVERELQGRLDQRKFEERCYCLLLEYLATLPALDKDGQAMSVGALKDLLKMQRRQANQLATHRIQVPSALWRSART